MGKGSWGLQQRSQHLLRKVKMGKHISSLLQRRGRSGEGKGGEREKRNLLVLQARELPSGSYLPQRELLNSLWSIRKSRNIIFLCHNESKQQAQGIKAQSSQGPNGLDTAHRLKEQKMGQLSWEISPSSNLSLHPGEERVVYGPALSLSRHCWDLLRLSMLRRSQRMRGTVRKGSSRCYGWSKHYWTAQPALNIEQHRGMKMQHWTNK